MSGDELPFASPGQIVGYDRKTYVVTAYRWGDTERHSYVVDVAPSLEAAKASAAEEEERRGGKYSCGIVEMAAKGAWRTVVEPEQNPDICRPGAARRDDLGEALLWLYAAEHNAHTPDPDWCDTDNGATGPGDIPCSECAAIADMRETAEDAVIGLLVAIRGGYSVADATCGKCKYTWVAVVPGAPKRLQCPRCGDMATVFMGVK